LKELPVLKKIIGVLVLFIVLGCTGAYFFLKSVKETLPKIESIKDYDPLLVSQVFDRNNKKIGEFSFQRRILIPYEKMPKNLINAFLAAEDDQFFHHSGINFQAILRATFANIKAGKSVQGGSTISQQVAKTFFLSAEKTFLRKIREALLALQIEDKLKKEEILYLYLNQIYFGQGAYGVEAAAQNYYRKSVAQLTLSEMAILAGLPKAPSSYSPVHNSVRAKERQVYVLRRMADVGFITKEESEKAIQEPIRLYINENYDEYAPHFLEAVRQILRDNVGEDLVFKSGLNIYTSLDLDKQRQAQQAVEVGLKKLDKRQGFRGPIKKITDPNQQLTFIKELRKKIIINSTPVRTILHDGKFAEIASEKPNTAGGGNLPSFLKMNETYEGIVESVDDNDGLVIVKLPDAEGIIPMETMTWARIPDTTKKSENNQIQKPSQALSPGDVIQVKIVSAKFEVKVKKSVPKNGKFSVSSIPKNYDKYLNLELDQTPLVEGALISFDQDTEDILAMVGGYKFERKKNEFNRAIQAARQSGSIFKSIVYASALDHGYNPSSLIMDVPLVYEEKVSKSQGTESSESDNEGQEEETKIWKPANHSKTFSGEITFRNALVRSLNAPAVKVVEDVGVKWAIDYSQRMGIFSPLNQDFTLVLGSSSVTLYEMTKVFSQFGRMGKRIRPRIILAIKDRLGNTIKDEISLDVRFEKEIKGLDNQFASRREEFKKIADPSIIASDKKPDKHFFFNDPEQLIDPKTAYVTTSLLKGVVEDPNGTGARAKALGREVAGKTGTTSGYFDAWFIGYTPQVATGVWVGFDKEQSLGLGEVGGHSALPIWLSYMKDVHQNLPEMTFPVPEGIVFVNIDGDTGKLASAHSKRILKQAFVEGTEPSTTSTDLSEDKNNFYKQDLNE